MRIAVVQQEHNPGRVEENRRKALGFAGQALDMGADIVLFHEELLIGYHPDAASLAESLYGKTTLAFQTLLSGCDAAIVYGLTERDGDRLYISAPVVREEGICANYRKTHLWWNAQGIRDETALITPGDSLVTFRHAGAKIGLMICYDGDFPEMFRAYARMGCDAVLWLNNRGSRGHLDGPVDAARRNSLIVASACCCGIDEAGNRCPGLSNIVDSDGMLFAEKDGCEGIICADVDVEKARRLRKENPWFRGLRPELYAVEGKEELP